MKDVASLTDAELITHYTEGGSALALQALIKRYHPLVRRLALERAPDHETAMALMEKVFLVLGHKANQLIDQKSIADWLRGVVATEPLPMPAGEQPSSGQAPPTNSKNPNQAQGC